MAIKDILVHATDANDGDGRLATAAALARSHGAHLTGLYTLWIPVLPAYVQSQIGEEVLRAQQESYIEMMNAARGAFEAAAGAEGIEGEWRCMEGEPAHNLVMSARYCDLLVIGHHEHPGGDSAVPMVETAVLQTGKPVLVMPEERPAQAPGKHVCVAWNASREASRAIDAALPLLAAAERVDVVVVNARSEGDAHGEVPAADLCAHLARHGVRADAQSLDVGHHGIGETLLSRAGADGADLLVMGAYGHARWREMVLGGATAHVLHHAHIPVLMAH